MSDQALMIPQVEDVLQLRLGRSPNVLIQEASLCAKSLMTAVNKNEWAINLGGKKPHLMYEAWAFLATMYRVTPRVVPNSTRLIEIGSVIGFEAEAEAFHVPSQLVISTGNAMCLNDEDNWGLRPKYEWQGPTGKRTKVKVGEVQVPLFQLRSMAQTRAQAKALKGPLSWIVAMAGFASRAAEESTGDEVETEPAAGPAAPQRKAQENAGGGPQTISEKQASRIWALGHAANKSKEEIIAIVKHFGFDSAKDITTDAYEKVCNEIQRGDNQ